ncbi:MAG TPA: C40 family peptidase [Candidatus Nosocomiicoccus stercorigallinarum]|nr:C40 family peptidase [Candidatus Nosocomiicoccus stercorigallinarum]
MRLVLSLLLMAFISMSFTSEVHALMLEKKTIKPSATSELKIVQPSTTAAEYALKLAVGKRYVWGGNSDTDVDCSSFAQQFMRGYKGIQISRTTYDQVKEGTKVNDPMPGDLVFFNDFAHVGVYVGDGMMVDALNPEEGVGLRAVSYVHGKVDGYYRY